MEQNTRNETRHGHTRHAQLSRRHSVVAALFPFAALSIAACVARGSPERAATGERLLGRGFSIAAPAESGWASGWAIGSRGGDAIEFHMHPGKQVRRPDTAPYTLNAGAIALQGNPVNNTQGESFLREARALLARRLSAPDRDILSLELKPATLNTAVCAAYRAVQVDRYFPEKIEERNEYAYRGLLCIHPSSANLRVQVFYNEQFLRGSPPAQRIGDAEAQAFFAQLQWTAPPPH